MSRTRKDTIHWLRVSEDQFGTTLPIPLPLIVASAKRRCRPSLVLGLPASSAPTRTGLQCHSPALGLERSFSLLRHNRRLMACYDALAMVAVLFAKLAMISLMLKRLTSA
jgi:hypothetical protein